MTLREQFRACAAEHSHHLTEGAHSIGFDVKFGGDGQVDSVMPHESTLGDEVLELCLVRALRSFSEDDLLPLRSEDRPYAPVAPESRALVGMAPAAAAAACLASLPCVVTVGFLMGASYITVTIFVQGTSKHWPSLPKPQIWPPTKPAPTQPAPATSTGPTPPIPPQPPDCPRNESFTPERTDNATGCFTKKGKLQCYASRHPPCEGVHTHGRSKYQEVRRGTCVEVDKEAVRCDGPFKVAGPCGSVATVECGTEGWASSGIFVAK
jgi:hypothetical protein